jgi:phage terminase large subunit-like protein
VLEGKLDIWLRAFLNIWVDRTSPPIFRAGRWEQCHRPDAVRLTRPVLAVDVSADRTHASVTMGALSDQGHPMVRLVEYRPGTDWVVDRVLELREEYEVAAVVLDAAGPAKSLIVDFENNNVDVQVSTAQDMVAACGMIWDAVDQGTLSHFGEPALQLAVQGAEKRVLLDAWAWTRTKSAELAKVDISPLVALTLAHWGQLKFGEQEVSGDDAW